MSWEEFLITDRGISLYEKSDIRYERDGEILIFHQPSGTLLSKEFIENNNRFVEEELSRINRNIENIEFAIEHKDYSYITKLKDMYKLRYTVKANLDEFKELANRMY